MGTRIRSSDASSRRTRRLLAEIHVQAVGTPAGRSPAVVAAREQGTANEDYEAWTREIIEALRPIDPPALFWVGLAVDFQGASGHDRADFPYEEMRRFVDEWLATLKPTVGEATAEWTGGGVRIGFRARPRSGPARGWKAQPSLNLLEQRMADLHLVGGGRRQLHTLTLEELGRLARGELRVLGQGATLPW